MEMGSELSKTEFGDQGEDSNILSSRLKEISTPDRPATLRFLAGLSRPIRPAHFSLLFASFLTVAVAVAALLVQISPTLPRRHQTSTTSLLPPLCSSPDLQTPDLCSCPRLPLASDNPAAARGGRGEMLRLRAFRPTSDKVVKIQLHPTHPWLVTADANDRVSVWNWEHRQVIYELKAGGVDERRLVGAKLEKLAEGDDSKGKPTEAIRGGSMEFLSRSSSSDAPLVAFGSSDGVIRVLSMLTWKLVRRYTGGHKGAIACLMTYMSAAGEVHLVSGGNDGLLILWSADHIHDSRELVPKISMKAHDGGVVAVELSRVMGSAPQLITIGADKTLAIWDTVTFKEIRRIKPVPKLACHSVASWCHPRAPNLDILTCVKDSHIWAIEHPTYSALTRPLCELSSLVPPQVLAQHKKLRVYCMVAHPLQPHLVATGTNIGVILSEFDPRALPAIAPLPTPTGSKEHSAVYIVERELKLLNFQLSNTANPSLGNAGVASDAGRSRNDSLEQLIVNQSKKHISTPAPHDSYSVLSVSSSGKYVAIVWPDIPSFAVCKASDWSVVDSGTGKLFAWDTCRDRYALVESALAPRMPLVVKGGSSKKAKEAAAAAAQAAAAAASAASAATVQVRILLDDGTAHVLQRSIDGRSEPVTKTLLSSVMAVIFQVIGLHGGALLGVTYRTSRRISPLTATAISTVQSMPLSGFGGSGSSFASDDPWETYQPVSGLLAQPEWTAWDQTVEYCAFAYQQYIVISSLRPQFRYLGDVSIPFATGAVWHRRQLFVATPTTIECVFVDAGVADIDIETKRRKEEMKAREAQSRAVEEHGDLALITVEAPQVTVSEKVPLRPPMLQVVRLASFQHAPSIPPFIVPKQSKFDGDDSVFQKELDDRRYAEVAVAGGGVSVAVTRFPPEQKRPIGPLVVVGVRDGVLWLVDRYMCAHALSLSHPGIRCRCLAAYGDPVSAVKWATRLGREHHDDLAQFMLGMGYATEALHLPGISKRLEFDLAMQSNDLKRALACLLTMSNSRDVGQETAAADATDVTQILNLAVAKQAKQESLADAVQGIVKFVKEFFDLIDAADATGQSDIAREVLKRLAAAASVKGALHGQMLRGLALRLANHGELTRLSGLVSNLITAGHGREAAFAAAVLGDNALMEKAWQDTGMLAEAVLHAQAHGRPSLRNLVITWNKMLQKELDHTPTVKTDAAAAFLASLEDPKLTSLGETEKKPPIEILPPGMPPLSAPPIVIKKSGTKPGLPNAVKASNGPIGAPMVQGAPMAQGTPGAQGIPMNQVTPSQGSDEAKPLEATVVDAAPTTSEGTAAPAAAEGTAAPSSEEAKAAPGSEGGTSHPINEEATAVAVSDAPGSPDAAAAAALAPAADTSSSDAPAVTPSEVTVSPPSTDAPELTDKPSPTEASLPPPPSVSGV
ncbi:Transducin/WD40 repeat-like superfamily protein [Zea mays]|uniref:Transducin/WD40 repeat-like superfamily protein n=1 Tax=Zea mays TaxID=4577 RepID=A0A1D6G0I9_MAIZE|nr:Transducin/WD40 repeat-like superfamily protein [Zea mays]